MRVRLPRASWFFLLIKREIGRRPNEMTRRLVAGARCHGAYSRPMSYLDGYNHDACFSLFMKHLFADLRSSSAREGDGFQRRTWDVSGLNGHRIAWPLREEWPCSPLYRTVHRMQVHGRWLHVSSQFLLQDILLLSKIETGTMTRQWWSIKVALLISTNRFCLGNTKICRCTSLWIKMETQKEWEMKAI